MSKPSPIAPIDLSEVSDDFYRKVRESFLARLLDEPDNLAWHFMAEIVRENLRLRQFIRGGVAAACGADGVDANGSPV